MYVIQDSMVGYFMSWFSFALIYRIYFCGIELRLLHIGNYLVFYLPRIVAMHD